MSQRAGCRAKAPITDVPVPDSAGSDVPKTQEPELVVKNTFLHYIVESTDPPTRRVQSCPDPRMKGAGKGDSGGSDGSNALAPISDGSDADDRSIPETEGETVGTGLALSHSRTSSGQSSPTLSPPAPAPQPTADFLMPHAGAPSPQQTPASFAQSSLPAQAQQPICYAPMQFNVVPADWQLQLEQQHEQQHQQQEPGYYAREAFVPAAQAQQQPWHVAPMPVNVVPADWQLQLEQQHHQQRQATAMALMHVQAMVQAQQDRAARNAPPNAPQNSPQDSPRNAPRKVQTTKTLHNIPKHETLEDLLAALQKLLDSKGCPLNLVKVIDYAYMPWDFKNDKLRGFAIFSFRYVADAECFDEFFDGYPIQGSKNPLEVRTGKWTKEEMIEKHSSHGMMGMMQLDVKYLPKIFDENGNSKVLEPKAGRKFRPLGDDPATHRAARRQKQRNGTR